MSENEQASIQRAKDIIDYLKHFVSIATASLVFVVSFVPDISDDPEWVTCLSISIGAFIITIFCSTICYTLRIWLHPRATSRGVIGKKTAVAFGIMIVGLWGSLISGFIFTAAFVIKNI